MCDTLVSQTDDGVLFAKNSDRDPNEAQLLEWHPPRRSGPASTVRATWIEIPDAPEETATGDEPILVTGAVVAPVKLHAPTPGYTEAARRVRIQGTVILQAVIDREGRIRELEVLKSLPFGLTEQAVSTVRDWTFEPATLGGLPVTVRFNLSIRFQLQ